jgi:hypothetical protein
MTLTALFWQKSINKVLFDFITNQFSILEKDTFVPPRKLPKNREYGSETFHKYLDKALKKGYPQSGKSTSKKQIKKINQSSNNSPKKNPKNNLIRNQPSRLTKLVKSIYLMEKTP